MRFCTFATVLVVVALVITDVTAKKSNRDKRTAKSGKQKQNDFHGSHEKEERVDDVLISEKKAKDMLNSKDRKRRSIEEEIPKYERKEYLAATKNIKPGKDKERTTAKIEVEQADHQCRKSKRETCKKSGRVEELRKSKEIVENSVGSAEDYVSSGKKSVAMENLEKPSKISKRETPVEEQDVRSNMKKDEEKGKKWRVVKKEKITKIEDAAVEETENVVGKMENSKIEETLDTEDDSSCDDDSLTEEKVEVKNLKKCTCNEDVARESIEKIELQANEAEELKSCKESRKLKSDKYAKEAQKKNCHLH